MDVNVDGVVQDGVPDERYINGDDRRPSGQAGTRMVAAAINYQIDPVEAMTTLFLPLTLQRARHSPPLRR